MNRNNATQLLQQWDQKHCYVFSKSALAKLFENDNQKTFDEGLRRLVRDKVLMRACHGIYVNPNAKSMSSDTLFKIVAVLRSGFYNYLSLESMLSEYGAISQMMTDRLTVMTTGIFCLHLKKKNC